MFFRFGRFRGKTDNLTLKGKFFTLLNTFNPKIHLFSPNSAKKIFFFSRKHIKLVGKMIFRENVLPAITPHFLIQ